MVTEKYYKTIIKFKPKDQQVCLTCSGYSPQNSYCEKKKKAVEFPNIESVLCHTPHFQLSCPQCGENVPIDISRCNNCGKNFDSGNLITSLIKTLIITGLILLIIAFLATYIEDYLSSYLYKTRYYWTNDKSDLRWYISNALALDGLWFALFFVTALNASIAVFKISGKKRILVRTDEILDIVADLKRIPDGENEENPLIHKIKQDKNRNANI